MNSAPGGSISKSIIPVAPGMDEPVEIIGACHDRVRAQCATLRRLLVHVQGAGADQAAREAVASVMRYFDEAAPHHHADEECDLFPALREHVLDDQGALGALVDALLEDHRRLEALWRDLRPLLVAVSEGLVQDSLTERTLMFASAYERHADREDEHILPLARSFLGEDTRARLSEAMVARRRRD